MLKSPPIFSKLQRPAWNVDGISDDLPRRPIERVGIIGAGTMGGGISMNFASAGIPVTIVETKQEALDRGLGVIQKNYQRSADRGRFPQEEVAICMGQYSPTLDFSALADCDLIIEAVFEDMEIKKSVFSELDKIAKPGAILATNTSALNIDEIAAVTSRPSDVIGLHFFSPANVMRLLEIVRAQKTADDVVATSVDLAKTIGKVAALVGVCPGFVGNRILLKWAHFRWRTLPASTLAGKKARKPPTQSVMHCVNWIDAAKKPVLATTTMMKAGKTSPPM
jgi:3-hydroxyacyl-CoA dehydrogenase